MREYACRRFEATYRLERQRMSPLSFINGCPNDTLDWLSFRERVLRNALWTTDSYVLLNLFKDIQSGMIQDGNGIGLGLANACERIKTAKQSRGN
jgi:Ca-activated chloride channel family protein